MGPIRQFARLCALAVASMAGTAVVAMAACPQALAVYGDAGQAAEIAFAGALGDADAMLHRFTLVFAGGTRMDGVVMLAGEPDRPWGILMHQCPEGDATGAEIEACTVWQGPIYAIDGKGNVRWLPVPAGTGDQAAGQGLLLPDLGAAIMQSAAWRAKQITALPGDAFRLAACQE